jgi:cytochrome c peroxidase
MKRWSAAFLALVCAAVVAVATLGPARGEDAPGLTLFKKNGCNECHAISALGVEKETKKKSGDAAAESAEKDGEKKKKKEAPDLSGVGLDREAKWISAYLNKEEAIDGEKHEKRFKGSESDRRTIAMWLASLKTEVKAPATDAGEPAKKDGDG